MSRCFVLLSLCLLLLPLSALRANECTVLTAAGNVEYSPYLWRQHEPSEEVVGANRLVMDEIARRLDITIQVLDVGSWARAQEMLKRGRVDLMAGIFYTESRAIYMNYISPAFFKTASVVWRKSNTQGSYDSRDDLIGLHGVTVINNSFGQDFDEYAKEKLDLTYVPSLAQAFLMLDRGRADYVLYEKNPGLAYAELLGYKGRFDILDPSLSTEGLYLAVSKKSKCNTLALRNRLAVVIADMQAEGFMDQALSEGFESWRIFLD
ncbi:substrate-binding periplasmic protein [Neptuniibacter marinus]|uniref:substrate-binding periplasmic protein n=1 Tax=Neptuniibacter marinus TaxID=1806670 RepID=UPI003B59CA20